MSFGLQWACATWNIAQRFLSNSVFQIVANGFCCGCCCCCCCCSLLFVVIVVSKMLSWALVFSNIILSHCIQADTNTAVWNAPRVSAPAWWVTPICRKFALQRCRLCRCRFPPKCVRKQPKKADMFHLQCRVWPELSFFSWAGFAWSNPLHIQYVLPFVGWKAKDPYNSKLYKSKFVVATSFV